MSQTRLANQYFCANSSFWIGIILTATILASALAEAVPSFARQTGQDCSGCHIGSFGPQLTPFGQKFKLAGYTDSSNGDFQLPLSAMAVVTYDKTSADLPDAAVTPSFSANNNLALQEASLFLAGRATDHLGGFVQVTYSGIEKITAIDNVDIRYAGKTSFANQASIVGISINNNPSIQDLWNTAPAWSFPYMSADLAPGLNGTPLISGGLSQQVLGLTGYLLWNDHIYAEAGAYRTQPTSLLKHTHVVETADDVSEIKGAAPYWRLAYENAFDRQNVSVGLVGLQADIHPGRVAGPTDNYRDIGIDSTYQFLGTRRHIFSVNASYIRETQNLNAAVASASADQTKNETNATAINGSYYYQNTYGFTLGYFNNQGSKTDHSLFAENPLDGSRLGHSDSAGFVLQADYTPFGKDDSWNAPFANLRVGLQYVIYSRYNGASKNYDGFGRNATDNNTLMLMIWTSI